EPMALEHCRPAQIDEQRFATAPRAGQTRCDLKLHGTSSTPVTVRRRGTPCPATGRACSDDPWGTCEAGTGRTGLPPEAGFLPGEMFASRRRALDRIALRLADRTRRRNAVARCRC